MSPGAAYFLDPDGFGWVYNPAGSFGSGRRPLPAEEGLAVSKGDVGDTAATERFCEEVLHDRAPAFALLWLSEPDYTGHHSPLGSPAHRRAIVSADTNVRRVADIVATLDSMGENILFVVGSDHGMETVDTTIDLDGLLIDAGLKSAPASSDVVVAPNGTSALLYFSDPAGPLIGQTARFLATQDWVGRIVVGPDLASAGLPTSSPMQIASRSKPTTAPTRMACRATAMSCATSLGPKDMHRLRPAWRSRHNEQSPFLFVSGGGFTAGPPSRAPRSSTSRRPCSAISAFPSTASTAARCLAARTRSDPLSSGAGQPFEFRF